MVYLLPSFQLSIHVQLIFENLSFDNGTMPSPSVNVVWDVVDTYNQSSQAVI